jgi:hypothetical protein
MNLFQIGLLFLLPVHTYLLTCETGYWSIFIYVYMTGCVKLVNPEVVCHPSMAKTTIMHANSLPPFWYG